MATFFCRSPAEAGAHLASVLSAEKWTPAFAGERM
jgi:hypothetical protein